MAFPSPIPPVPLSLAGGKGEKKQLVASKLFEVCLQHLSQKMTLRWIAPALCSLLLPAGVAHAHLGGLLFERPSNGYLAEIGMDATEIRPHVPTAFSVALVRDPDTKDWAYVPSTVDVRIRRDGQEIAHETLRTTERELAYMTFTFPGDDLYEFETNFIGEDGTPLAGTTLTLIVTRLIPIGELDWLIVLLLLAGTTLGLLMALYSRTSSPSPRA